MKSSEAFAKNQIRLGEKYAEKAKEFCDERGKDGLKVAEILKTIDTTDPEKANRQAEFEKAKVAREKAMGN